MSLLLVICMHGVVAQKQLLDTLLLKFDAYRVPSTTEKIYAHLDQDTYLTGETLWLKLYLVHATTHVPLNTSKVAYVEIIDNLNNAVLQTKIPLNNGVGSGSVFIPASMASNNYMVRAYTTWMKNFDPAFYFHRQITVINPFKRLEDEKRSAVARPQVVFFPEGGTLPVNVRTRVAYRILNTTDPMAALTLHLGNDSLILTPDKYGMGSFEYTPLPGVSAVAAREDGSGRRQMFTLPVAAERGYALRVKDSTAQNISVNIHGVNFGDPRDPVYVLIHARNVISFARMQYLTNGEATLLIPRSELAEGISHITVFDANMRAVCERLYFNPVKRMLSIAATQSQQEYGIRRKVTLDLQVSNENGGNNAPANLSVAVYRLDSLRNNDSNILNYIWLDADLIDVPPLPADFMKDITPEKRMVLDHIMLTHGWRRFSWPEVVSGRQPVVSIIPELQGHIIRGKVTDENGNPLNNILTYLSAPGLNIQVYGSLSRGSGDVQYEMKDFSGQRRIVVQTNLAKDSTSRITILSPFSDQYAMPKITPFTLSPKLTQTLTERSFGMQVQDIYYRDKGLQYRSVAIDTTAFYGKADNTYYLDDYTRFPVMEEVMREYVPGVLVRKRRDGFHFMNLDDVNKAVFHEDPFVMLDGLPVFDVDRIMEFDPLKVKKLEVVRRRYYLGVLSFPGIVSYTTYAGDLGGFNIDPRCVVLDYEGLQLQREFHAPKYENAKQRESRLPDQRDRLFWAPFVVTDDAGRQRLEFYTSDITGQYEVLVEGLDATGAAGGAKSRFTVVSLQD